MKVVLSGGGTGGHIYPALALMREIRSRYPGATFLYIGTERGLEAEIVPREGVPFASIEVSGFKRKITIANMKTLWQFFMAVNRAKQLIRGFGPDVVIGTGGYVCGPVVYAANKLHIPTLIHEQNVIPGLTNKFLARFTDRVCVSFTGSSQYFPKEKTVVTGNPRATEVAQADGEKGRDSLNLPRDKKIVLIVGGSRGARPINDAFLSVLPRIGEEREIHFVYVTGEAHFAQIQKAVERLEEIPKNLTIRPFIYNMPEVLASTDLIINRSGASFLAEITALGIPAILVPSPYVTNNHQEKNARWMEEQGAAAMILEKDLNGDVLLDQIHRILRQDSVWQDMSRASRKMGQPDAAALVCREIGQMVS